MAYILKYPEIVPTVVFSGVLISL